MAEKKPLTVAVTGPTGDIGRAYLRALDRARGVGRVLGMARRPFDPADQGLKKTEDRQGDILDRGALDELVAEADVVVHLAFVIMGGQEETRRINLEGSRNVFAAAAAAPSVERLVYTSSVAAYGFHEDNPLPLTEDLPPRGTEAHYYSAQKGELEGTLREELEGSGTEAYLFRPCIVAGGDALLLIENIPYVQVGERLPDTVRRLLGTVPLLKPVLPDPGVPFQLVHQDDVAAALVAATTGRGEPGTYNLAGEGELTMSDLARELGWHAVPVPELAVEATAELVSRLPFAPPQASWVNAFTVPVVMDTSKARRALRWKPKHDSRSVLRETVAAARARGLV
jgi:nucleoside-diphosphate-sugar epimerase